MIKTFRVLKRVIKCLSFSMSNQKVCGFFYIIRESHFEWKASQSKIISSIKP